METLSKKKKKKERNVQTKFIMVTVTDVRISNKLIDIKIILSMNQIGLQSKAARMLKHETTLTLYG